jgi:uncharacterized protein (DUF1330 family)
MQTKYSVACAVLAGVVMGALAVTSLQAHAPEARTRPAFYIAELEISDPEGFRPYEAHVVGTVEAFGGHVLARAGTIAPLEGQAPKGRVVIIAFESMEKAHAWYDSSAYQALKAIRHKAAQSRTYIVEGTAH